MPKSIREILEHLLWQSTDTSYQDKDIDQALTDIYSLLAEGVEDKPMTTDRDVNIRRDGWNAANAAWRKHLQERLK